MNCSKVKDSLMESFGILNHSDESNSRMNDSRELILFYESDKRLILKLVVSYFVLVSTKLIGIIKGPLSGFGKS